MQSKKILANWIVVAGFGFFPICVWAHGSGEFYFFLIPSFIFYLVIGFILSVLVLCDKIRYVGLALIFTAFQLIIPWMVLIKLGFEKSINSFKILNAVLYIILAAAYFMAMPIYSVLENVLNSKALTELNDALLLNFFYVTCCMTFIVFLFALYKVLKNKKAQ